MAKFLFNLIFLHLPAGTSSPLLMKTSLSSISNEECNQHYEQDDEVLSSGVVSTQLCAKDYEKLRDTCQVI